jgi:phosphoribosylformylglycinamidine cyclo-ligase
VEEAELRRTFNLGVGLVAVVAEGSAEAALRTLVGAGERAWPLGRIEARHAAEAPRVEFL